MKFNIVVCVAFLVSGCSKGIYSNNPILNRGESDKLYNAEGYWFFSKGIRSYDNHTIRTLLTLGRSAVFFVEDKTDNNLGFKSYLYNIQLLNATKALGEDSYDNLLMVKKSEDSYAIQDCNKEYSICRYYYSLKINNNYYVYPIFKNAMSTEIKNLLSSLYINANKKNDIKISDAFVKQHGKELIDFIINTTKTDPESEENNITFFYFTKVSEKQSKYLSYLIDKNKIKYLSNKADKISPSEFEKNLKEIWKAVNK